MKYYIVQFYVQEPQFFLLIQHYLQCLKNRLPKFQLIVVSGFGIIVLVLESRKNKQIDLYTEIKLQALVYTAITFVCMHGSNCSP